MAKPLLTEELWSRIEPLFPANKARPPGSHPPIPDRNALMGILFVLRTGCPWEYLPQEIGGGSGMTCWRRLRAWRVGIDLAFAVGRTWAGRRDRLEPSDLRQVFRASVFWGALTGSNPADRGKNGSKRHVVCGGQGIPLALLHTGANVHDSEQALLLIDAIPPIKRPGGGRRKRPAKVYADRAYDAERKIRQPLCKRGIEPVSAKRNTEHGSGLGKHRCVVEGVFAWLFKFRRLRVRDEKRDDKHTALLLIGCLLIGGNRIERFR